MSWLLVQLVCGHVGGCEFETKTFHTEAECRAAMTIPAGRWLGRETQERMDPRFICIPFKTDDQREGN